MQQREPSADQAHIVIQRQPTDANIVGRQLHRFADRADVGEQIRVREHHPFGIAGRARGVLQKREIAAFAHAAAGKVCWKRAGSGRLRGIRGLK